MTSAINITIPPRLFELKMNCQPPSVAKLKTRFAWEIYLSNDHVSIIQITLVNNRSPQMVYNFYSPKFPAELRRRSVWFPTNRYSNDQSVYRDRSSSRTISSIHNSNATIGCDPPMWGNLVCLTGALSLGHASLHAIWSINDDEVSKSYKNCSLGTIGAPNCYLLEREKFFYLRGQYRLCTEKVLG